MPSPLASRLFQLRTATASTLRDAQCSRSFTNVLERAVTIASYLRTHENVHLGDRVLLLGPSSVDWVEAFLAIVIAGGIAVPLSPTYPAVELQWFAEDAGARLAIVSADQAEKAGLLLSSRKVLWLHEASDIATQSRDAGTLPTLSADTTALLLYTSGTTGKPKGARITHENIATQAQIMGEAWGVSPRDTLLHALPLHHLHGLGISLLNALLSGASIRLLPKFEAKDIWNEFAERNATMWMAVPTMYQKLLEALDAAPPATQEFWKKGACALRLCTSGSAALPVRTAERWRDVTGAIPLERFGMTEIGVGLTNPLDPNGRKPGWVGFPPRTVEVRVVDDNDHDVPEGQGELLVRGPSVFGGYWNRPDSTQAAFRNGYFVTGDRAERDHTGCIRLLGRTSVDILKSGGYKLSSLEIEETLREHPAVSEVAVVGLPDETWGDRVVAAIVAKPGHDEHLTTETLRAWAKERIAPYKIPREVVLLSALPRNLLGKVVKPDLVALLKKRTAM